jgi:hypothetical protein
MRAFLSSVLRFYAGSVFNMLYIVPIVNRRCQASLSNLKHCRSSLGDGVSHELLSLATQSMLFVPRRWRYHVALPPPCHSSLARTSSETC